MLLLARNILRVYTLELRVFPPTSLALSESAAVTLAGWFVLLAVLILAGAGVQVSHDSSRSPVKCE